MAEKLHTNSVSLWFTQADMMYFSSRVQWAHWEIVCNKCKPSPSMYNDILPLICDMMLVWWDLPLVLVTQKHITLKPYQAHPWKVIKFCDVFIQLHGYYLKHTCWDIMIWMYKSMKQAKKIITWFDNAALHVMPCGNFITTGCYCFL